MLIRRMNHKTGTITSASDYDFFELIDEFTRLKHEFFSSSLSNKFLDKEIIDMDYTIKEIQSNDDSFYISLLNNLLKIEFFRMNLEGYVSFKDKFDENSLFSLKQFLRLTSPSNEYIIESFKPKNYLNIFDVFYIDSFSIFDLNRRPIGPLRRKYFDHVDYLRLIIQENEEGFVELRDEKKNKVIIDVEEKIEEIIGGKFEFKNRKFIFNSKNNGPLRMQETASGIKQIGIIQLLLSCRKLKEDSFLIFDEPEVNLHPEWQFKLAQILVLLVKDLNISLYINTHSPMFIEAIEVFTKYYNLEDDTYYYLTKLDDDSEREGYKFKYIDIKNIYELYDNLSDPYDKIDNYRLKANLKKNDF